MQRPLAIRGHDALWRLICGATLLLASSPPDAGAQSGVDLEVDPPDGAPAWEAKASPGVTPLTFLAGNGSTLHSLSGNYSGVGPVVYRRSTDEGGTWGANVVVGSGVLYLEDPLISDGSNVYVAYVRDIRSVSDWLGPRPLGNIYFRASADDGQTWGPELALTTSPSMLRLSLAVSGPRVYVTWMDYRWGVWDVCFRRSLDAGATWLPEVRLVAGTSGMGAERPQVACVGSTVHVAWMDGRDGKPPVFIEELTTVPLPQSTEIYAKSSLDSGASWGADIRLTTHPTDYSGRPDIAATPEGGVLVSYDHAWDGGKLEEFLVRSTDSGASWLLPQRLSFSDSDSTHNYLVAAGGLVHLAWSDQRASGIGVYYRQSSDGGVTWGEEEFAGPAAGRTAPFAAATSDFVHISWDGNYRRRALASPSPAAIGDDGSGGGGSRDGGSCGGHSSSGRAPLILSALLALVMATAARRQEKGAGSGHARFSGFFTNAAGVDK